MRQQIPRTIKPIELKQTNGSDTAALLLAATPALKREGDVEGKLRIGLRSRAAWAWLR